MYTYDDTNVCFMHACLLGGRCLDRRCRVLLKHPGTLCGGCFLPEGDRCQRCKKKKNIVLPGTFMHLFLISNVSIIILSRPSTQFFLFIDVAFLLY